MNRWWLAWVTQTTSMGGRGLSTFALGVWLYTETGSASWFVLLPITTSLPSILALPIAGVWADRVGPRLALTVAELAGLLTGLGLVALFLTGAVTPLRIVALLALGGLLTTMHWPAWSAATTVMVPEERLPKAAALMQLGYAAQQVVAPAVAGLLLAVAGTAGVVALDASTFAFGLLGAVLLVPRRRKRPVARSVRADLGEGWQAVRQAGLVPLCAYIVATYLPGAFVVALSTPLLLSMTTPDVLGWVLAAHGTGMIAGAVVASRHTKRTGGFARLLRYDLLLAGSMLATPLLLHPALLAIAGFAFTFGLAGLMAEEQLLWQTRVPVETQGRAFALRRTLTWGSLPVGYALAGLLADHLFVPAFGATWGIALLIAAAGLVKVGVVLSARAGRTPVGSPLPS